MSEDWLSRWNEGRIGWHENEGNAQLQEHWPELDAGTRVLVPLCGKAHDLLWLVGQGCAVTGVELSAVAIEEFFSENDLRFDVSVHGAMTEYRARDCDLALFCGDYFQFDLRPFDALYDRGALVALPADTRTAYVMHTRKLLGAGALRFLITLEYDQSVVNGPPYSVMPEEMLKLWPGVNRVSARDDVANLPPKFRAAGLRRADEVVWLSV
jgi:thiopurine S-methyltransferase